MGFVVALGHHLDDQAETTIFRLARGTGALTTLGMRRLSNGIWRPLLHLTKDEILEISDELGVAHRYDRSNDTIEYSRNQIRKQIIPVLREMNPAAASKITEWATQVTDIAEYIETLIDSSVTRLGDHSILMPQSWFSPVSIKPSVSIMAVGVALSRLQIAHNSFRSFYSEICDRIKQLIDTRGADRHRIDEIIEVWIEGDQVGLSNISLEPKFQKLERFAQCRSVIMSVSHQLIGQIAHVCSDSALSGGKLIEIQANPVEFHRIELQFS
jgi:hypothetical protein